MLTRCSMQHGAGQRVVSRCQIVMKNESIHLTIATVCRNALAYLPACIESVQPVHQIPGLRVEHLVIDGASTDGSVAFLQDELQKGRITRLVSEPDKGLYDAMNKAIMQAQGQVIVFINADDQICPDGVLEVCKPIIEGEADYVLSAAMLVDEAGRQLGVRGADMSKALLHMCCCHQAAYCSVDLLRRLGGFDAENYSLVADADLFTRIYESGARAAVSEAVTCRYYIGGASASVRSEAELVTMMIRHRESIMHRCRSEKGFAVQAVLNLYRLVRRCLRGQVAPPDEWCELMSALVAAMPVAEQRRLRTKWWFKYNGLRLKRLITLGRKASPEECLCRTLLS